MAALESFFKLRGLEFMKQLLEFERQRFDREFLRGSVYEQINLEFGPFPKDNVYPVYFAGDLENPKDKTVFIGINPGYKEANNREEQVYLREYGLFAGYCRIFSAFFKKQHTGLSPYYANIAGFLKRYKNVKKINWDWFQENFINLELIPYHSADAKGIRINDIDYYRKRYFTVILKILDHIKPRDPVFINGFPSFVPYFKNPPLSDLVTFTKVDNFWTGKINGKYGFIGLPFLTRVSGGKDNLVEKIKNHF